MCLSLNFKEKHPIHCCHDCALLVLTSPSCFQCYEFFLFSGIVDSISAANDGLLPRAVAQIGEAVCNTSPFNFLTHI